MKIPVGINITEGAKEDFALKMIRNICGQKQAGRVWNKYLHYILLKLGFVQSQVDECVYFRKGLIYLLNTDDSILASWNESEIKQAIEDIQSSGLKITIEGSLADFVCVNIQRMKDGKVKMSQPQLAKQICQDLGFKKNTKDTPIPAASSKILKRHQTSEEFDNSFNYRSVIGKLNYYEKWDGKSYPLVCHARFSFVCCLFWRFCRFVFLFQFCWG